MNDFRKKLLPSPDSSEILTPNALHSVLLGLQKPTPVQETEELAFMDPLLNDSQKAAVTLAVNAPELALVNDLAKYPSEEL